VGHGGGVLGCKTWGFEEEPIGEEYRIS